MLGRASGGGIPGQSPAGDARRTFTARLLAQSYLQWHNLGPCHESEEGWADGHGHGQDSRWTRTRQRLSSESHWEWCLGRAFPARDMMPLVAQGSRKAGSVI